MFNFSSLLHAWLSVRIGIGAAVIERVDGSNDLATRPFPVAILHVVLDSETSRLPCGTCNCTHRILCSNGLYVDM